MIRQAASVSKGVCAQFSHFRDKALTRLVLCGAAVVFVFHFDVS